MNPAKVATALNTISVAFGELAEALIEQPGSVAESPPKASSPLAATPAGSPVPADTFSDGTPIEEPFKEELEPIAPVLAATGGVEVGEGSLVTCPKHHVLYRDGKYGKYCPSTSDDPAWSNPKGFCKITPKNAAEYLRIKAAA